ncbi:hypothetical protein COY05_05105 [Candidatus Peregrinibacteria bacterium CG_4_10_14_0_2_um_filter_38_24]|nr:MAG: hypothetical protein COY05_05105 [Candidatus Peregrinibacteria bacterium CG_4_10_14_0_2_um_filter_38_24]PJC39345.1 MAG: hypothetical protein CO044_00275 [Candidatus Peregrinibacteria bacterium CG_4_9_14_0_2_um_filter_38_9]
MNILFLLLAFASLTSLIIGLIKPSAFKEIFKHKSTRKNLSIYFLAGMIIFFILAAISTGEVKQTPQYEVLDTIDLINGNKFAEILIPSFSKRTSRQELETVANKISTNMARTRASRFAS